MNYKKLILVGCISAFVAVLTSILGVAGTVIGSVISSVLYNMLSEALENPVSKASIKTNFEWELAYVFPLVVIALIQLLLIFALLAETGILPYGFVNVYLSIQDFANHNLYRILGIALLFISIYPLVLKPEFVKKEHGLILIFVGLIFLARGFVDYDHPITNLYDSVFDYFDLHIAIIAFILISFVIIRILYLSRKSDSEVKVIHSNSEEKSTYRDAQSYFNHKKDNHVRVREDIKRQPPKRVYRSKNIPKQQSNVKFKEDVEKSQSVANQKPRTGINKSSEKIHFESNDLLDDYKK